MASQYPHRRRGATTTPIVTAACGEDKPAAAAEYPCVRRSRQRRLLTFLWLQGFNAAFESIAGETDAVFSVPLLRQLVEEGKWADAGAYLSRFLPPVPPDVDDCFGQYSVEAQVLNRFLHLHYVLASIVNGGKDSVSVAASYNSCFDHGKTVGSGRLRIRGIVLNALHAKQYFRASIDWERVRHKASEIVDELAYRIPELKELVLMPGGPMKPHNVLPIGFGLRPRYRFKKQVRRPRASTLAKRFLVKKHLPVSSNHLQQGSHDELSDKAMNWAADAIDDCLKAGKPQEVHQEIPLQSSANKSAPSIPALHRTLDTSTNHVMKSVRGTGAPVSPLYRTMYGNMASPVRNPLVPVLANANINANPMLRTPAAPGAPLSGTMFRAPVLQTMLSNHVPTPGAPFSTTMFHPTVSRTVYGRLANPDKSSGISLMTSAGTNKHLSQENVECSQQALNPEIHPRAELTTSKEEDLDPDRKPATEALLQASVTKTTEAGDSAH